MQGCVAALYLLAAEVEPGCQASAELSWAGELDWLDAWYLVGYVTAGLGLTAALLLGSLGLNSWITGLAGLKRS